jgi:predicted P-loop ATPase
MSNEDKIAPAATVVAVGAPQPGNTLKEVEKYLSGNYNFRYNEVNAKLYYKTQSGSEYLSLSDYGMNTLVREMLHAGVKCNITLLRNTLYSNYTPVFNPFNEYFKGLAQWDGQTDYIMELAKTVTTTNDALWHKCFKKWFVAMVGCVLRKEIANHTVIVFCGQQGLGKTTWALNLLPDELREYSFSGTINPNNKDTLIHLSETMLINMDELENLNRADVDTLKELITKANIRVRRPYGFSTETMPRRASFMGSVNGKEFLNDPTGNRRFLCFEVTHIDYQHSVPLSAAYAQALHLLQTGFKYWFDKTEIDAINLNNQQFRNLAVEEELLTGYFEPCDASDADHLFTTTELLNWLAQKAKVSVTNSSKQKMGKALRANGYQRLKQQNRYVYALKELVFVPNNTTQMLSTQNLVSGLLG